MYSSGISSGVAWSNATSARTRKLAPTIAASQETTATRFTGSVSARAVPRLRERKGARSPAPLVTVLFAAELAAGAGGGRYVRGGAVLVPLDRTAGLVRGRDAVVGPRLGADDAVDSRVQRLVVRGLQGADVHAHVRAVVGVEGLDVRNERAKVRLGGAGLRAAGEAEVRRDCDRGEDPEDDHDDQELDEGETLLLAPQTLADLADHA